ncbi:SAM-dependent methyltransferase [Catenuloplanes atrovinosus]|uniref:SAM-dependent methyltransferase n=1 Tax=Catenuloplanes atrovinosus TaxID=137266 RepID=A0AAE3YLY1_9ACTN|nr:SAM-dependent methyltransferase [Catenuloplanes atrovinosus]MDR7274638.1 SAM-dependent methyltransferase [Catenuloplanes atrovinosus]
MSAENSEHAPPGVDTSTPHSARIYDWWLGGKDNFAVDRAVGQAFLNTIPTIRAMAKENRDFIHRVVEYLVRDVGVTQFLDVGTGIPTSPNLHEVAQAIDPRCRVVYVDNDPIVLVHARALLVSSAEGATEYIHADMRDAAGLLGDPALTRTLDLTRPVALTLIAVLMLIADADEPVRAVRELMDALPPGSFVVITHPAYDFDPPAVEKLVAITEGQMTFVPRWRADVEAFFAVPGWEMVEPGLVPVMAWHPPVPPEDPNAAYYWAGVARKR